MSTKGTSGETAEQSRQLDWQSQRDNDCKLLLKRVDRFPVATKPHTESPAQQTLHANDSQPAQPDLSTRQGLPNIKIALQPRPSRPDKAFALAIPFHTLRDRCQSLGTIMRTCSFLKHTLTAPRAESDHPFLASTCSNQTCRIAGQADGKCTANVSSIFGDGSFACFQTAISRPRYMSNSACCSLLVTADHFKTGWCRCARARHGPRTRCRLQQSQSPPYNNQDDHSWERRICFVRSSTTVHVLYMDNQNNLYRNSMHSI